MKPLHKVWTRVRDFALALPREIRDNAMFTLPLTGRDPSEVFEPMTPPYDPRPVAKRNLEDVRKRFAGDVANHVMEVHHEDGLYRHLRFRKPGTMMYHFDLITWPGYLTIQGDMGGYTFARTKDMFQFFRSGKDINPSYWGQKLQNGAGSGDRSVRIYNPDLVREFVKERYGEYVEDHEDNAVETRFEDPAKLDAWLKEAAQVWTDIQDEILLFTDKGEHEAREALSRYENGDNKVRLYDTWEWDLTDYDFHFLWCLFAIQWGVRTYDKAQEAAA